MKLSDLAFACYIYSQTSDFDSSYNAFRKATNPKPDLMRSEHRTALIAWLNKWGCRQFKKDHHSLASQEILSWFKKHKDALPMPHKKLQELSESELDSAGFAYERLAHGVASYKTKGRKRSTVSIGPTGASKILFAIRPKSLMLWDAPIRERLGFDTSADGYKSYLKHVTSIIHNLETLCEQQGFKLEKLPDRLGRSGSTLLKVIDEYYWITITSGCEPPSKELLALWLSWS